MAPANVSTGWHPISNHPELPTNHSFRKCNLDNITHFTSNYLANSLSQAIYNMILYIYSTLGVPLKTVNYCKNKESFKTLHIGQKHRHKQASLIILRSELPTACTTC